MVAVLCYMLFFKVILWHRARIHCTAETSTISNRKYAVTAATNPLLNQNPVVVVLNRPTRRRGEDIFGIYDTPSFIAFNTDVPVTQLQTVESILSERRVANGIMCRKR